MKHQLEEIVGQEPENHSVKRIRDEEPPTFPFWNRLPNEVKAMIVGKMDVATSASFKECGRTERELVRNHTKFLVGTLLLFLDGKMKIRLDDKRSEVRQFEWWIYENPSGGAKVEYSISHQNFKPRVVTLPSKTVATATSMILRRLLTEPTFQVYKLNLILDNYNQKIDLDSVKADIGLLTLWDCQNLKPVFSILNNKNLNFKAAVGVEYDDRRLLYEIDSLNYNQPQTLHASSTFPIDRDGSYCSFFFQSSIYCYEEAHEHLKNFWDMTLGLYRFENEADVNDKLELRKTTDDIMLLRAAYYYYDDDCVPYIQGDDWTEDEEIDNQYSDRIAFLKDGIDGYLSDYQLSILSIAYLVRLFRNEPEIEKVHDIAFDDLRLVVKKYKNVNLYEKLVAKLEALVP